MWMTLGRGYSNAACPETGKTMLRKACLIVRIDGFFWPAHRRMG